MGFLQELPQHFLSSYLSFLSNFINSGNCKVHHKHWKSPSVFFSCDVKALSLSTGCWTSWQCGKWPFYIPPFCIKGMEQEVNPEHHSPSRLRAAGWHITAVTLSIQTGEQALEWPMQHGKGCFTDLVSAVKCHYITITRDLISKSPYREI